MCNCVHVELLINYSLSKPYCTFLIYRNLALSEAKTTFLKDLSLSLILCLQRLNQSLPEAADGSNARVNVVTKHFVNSIRVKVDSAEITSSHRLWEVLI